MRAPTQQLTRRHALRLLSRSAKNGIITTSEAARALGRDAQAAAVYLSRMERSGWVARLRRGVYLVLALDASPLQVVPDDSWTLAVALFSPCYIGGWTAAEHWGLTEQIFRDVFVVSSGHTRARTPQVGGVPFRVVRVRPEAIAGAVLVWRGAVRVPMSDRERTLVDSLTHPAWLGGIRTVFTALRSYRESEFWAPDKLVQSMATFGTGAAAKRLEYLAAHYLSVPKPFIDALNAQRSQGVVKLDPTVDAEGKIETRWGLRVNVDLSTEDA